MRGCCQSSRKPGAGKQTSEKKRPSRGAQLSKGRQPRPTCPPRRNARTLRPAACRHLTLVARAASHEAGLVELGLLRLARVELQATKHAQAAPASPRRAKHALLGNHHLPVCAKDSIAVAEEGVLESAGWAERPRGAAAASEAAQRPKPMPARQARPERWWDGEIRSFPAAPSCSGPHAPQIGRPARSPAPTGRPRRGCGTLTIVLPGRQRQLGPQRHQQSRQQGAHQNTAPYPVKGQ